MAALAESKLKVSVVAVFAASLVQENKIAHEASTGKKIFFIFLFLNVILLKKQSNVANGYFSSIIKYPTLKKLMRQTLFFYYVAIVAYNLFHHAAT
ncbi:hypothetical protein GCM10027043_48790 [Ferruginibacter profundus]